LPVATISVHNPTQTLLAVSRSRLSVVRVARYSSDSTQSVLNINDIMMQSGATAVQLFNDQFSFLDHVAMVPCVACNFSF
jgi:hypothetical protein